MPKIIRDGGIVDDIWQVLDGAAAQDLPAVAHGHYLLPLSCWLKQPHATQFTHSPGVWIDGDQDLVELAAYLDRIPVIGIHFSAFADGTGFSTGAVLREALGFEGELRAFGEVIADQVPLLRRCGFNAFSLAEGDQLEVALNFLLGNHLSYQGSVHSPRTPFKFRYLNGGKPHA